MSKRNMKREKLVILNLYMFYAVILQCYGQWPLVEKIPKLFKNYKKNKRKEERLWEKERKTKNSG